MVHNHERHHNRHAGHHHGHDHGLAADDFGRAFAVGIGLNVAFMATEVGYGLASHSIALLADAGHNLGDVLGLVVAWLGTRLSRQAPTPRFTYGLGGSGILAALFNATFLLVVVGGLSWEAIGRFWQPEPVQGATVMTVATIGIALNGGCAWLFASGRRGDINIRGAFLHMVADAVVSAGIVVAGFVILMTNWVWLDPAVTLVVNGVIVWGTWGLLRDSTFMALGAVPPAIDPASVRTFLASKAGVSAVHDLHIWPISTTETALTAHLVMPSGHPGDGFLMSVCCSLKDTYGIGHATLQVETDAATVCSLAPEHVV